MDIAIGLPSTIPGVDRDALLGWARRAEERGFSSLGTIDRVAYPNLEPLIALSAAAAVTERIGLVTAIMIAPYRLNASLMAKQLLSVDTIAGGRLTVGIAVGGREDDYELSGADFHTRGKRFDEQLARLHEVFGGTDPVGPPPVRDGGPPLLIGGSVDAAVRRTVQHGAGWIAGGGGPDAFNDFALKVRDAWAGSDRDGEPRLAALAYYALGPSAEDHAARYLHHYYGFLGEETAGYIAAAALTDAEQVTGAIEAYRGYGCDELILFPCATDVDQVDLLADVALG